MKRKKSELALEYYRYGVEMTRIKQRTENWERVVFKKLSGLLATKTNFNIIHNGIKIYKVLGDNLTKNM